MVSHFLNLHIQCSWILTFVSSKHHTVRSVCLLFQPTHLSPWIVDFNILYLMELTYNPSSYYLLYICSFFSSCLILDLLRIFIILFFLHLLISYAFLHYAFNSRSHDCNIHPWPMKVQTKLVVSLLSSHARTSAVFLHLIPSKNYVLLQVYIFILCF